MLATGSLITQLEELEREITLTRKFLNMTIMEIAANKARGTNGIRAGQDWMELYYSMLNSYRLQCQSLISILEAVRWSPADVPADPSIWPQWFAAVKAWTKEVCLDHQIALHQSTVRSIHHRNTYDTQRVKEVENNEHEHGLDQSAEPAVMFVGAQETQEQRRRGRPSGKDTCLATGGVTETAGGSGNSFPGY